MIRRLAAWERRFTRSFGQDLTTVSGRRATWAHFLLVDHGVLRTVWTNKAEVAPGVFRSNQPSPARLELATRRGLRTVISLRGASRFSWHLLEEEAARNLGLNFHTIKLSARHLPAPATVLDLLDRMRDSPRPMLFHCKSGADRTGLAAALFLIDSGRMTPEIAAGALSWRHLHRRRGPTGILDFMVTRYAKAQRENGIGLRDWIVTEYDPAALTRAYRAPPER